MSTPFVLNARKDPQGRFAVLQTDGYINAAAGERIGEAAGLLMAEGYSRLIVDLEKSTVINSVGLSILIEIAERMREIHGVMVFCNLTKTIHKTFAITGMMGLAGLYGSEADATRGVLEAH